MKEACYATPSPAPVTKQPPLHSKSLCKDMARASGGAHNMNPLSWGVGTNGKDLKKGLSKTQKFFIKYTCLE